MKNSQQQVIQVKIKSDAVQMITWLDADPRIKVGAVISLKDDIRKWLIEEVYATQSAKSIERNWGFDNNNYDKHEGLSKYSKKS